MNTEGNTLSTRTQGENLVVDMRRLIGAFFRHLWKIAVVTLLCGLLMFSYSVRFVTPLYQTSTSFYITNKALINGTSTDINSSDLVTSMHLVDSYVAVLTTRDTQMDIIEHTGLNLTPAQLALMISATSINETEVMKVVVSSDDPKEAAIVADSIAHIVTTQVSEIVEGSSVKQIEKPIVPSSPYFPNYTKNTIIGLLAGFLFSVGVVFLLELFDTKIKSEDDIQALYKHPVLATVPDMKRNGGYRYKNRYYHRYGYYNKNTTDTTDDVKNFVGKNVNFAASEAYKLLRTKLQYSLPQDHKCPVFVVSSALPGEGKSTSSINLAYHFAQLNKRVLLVDGDMRRPSIAKKLSLTNYPGLSEYLTGFSKIEDLLQEYRSDEDQLPITVLTGGTVPPNPVELIDSENMSKAIEDFREQFDVIIFDMPPIDDVTDALVLSKYADGVLLVIRHNYCNRGALINTMRQVEFVNAKLLGFVLNCFNEETAGYYSKKYNSHYRKYGYYRHYYKENIAHKPVKVTKKKK